jgi:RNA polymerase sigma factor (sigma-70 family)
VDVIGGQGRTYPGVTHPPDEPSPPVHERLAELFRQHSPRVYAYARRHVEESHCDDVVSETFLVAWRRPDQVPPEPLPWLLVVARNVAANQRRTSRRADQLWFAAVREGWTATTPSAHEALAERETVLAALEQCTRAEREALLLTAWDGLTTQQAAAVADCSARAFTVRLHRARARLRTAMAAQEQCTEPAGEPVHATTRLAEELS